VTGGIGTTSRLLRLAASPPLRRGNNQRAGESENETLSSVSICSSVPNRKKRDVECRVREIGAAAFKATLGSVKRRMASGTNGLHTECLTD
jgi:hypothetical protein